MMIDFSLDLTVVLKLSYFEHKRMIEARQPFGNAINDKSLNKM